MANISIQKENNNTGRRKKEPTPSLTLRRSVRFEEKGASTNHQ